MTTSARLLPAIAVLLALGAHSCFGAPADRTPLFAPAAPLGVASELPRSPLADVIIHDAERFEAARAAQSHCPSDTVVWVEPWSALARPARFGLRSSAHDGAFMCAADASTEGDVFDRSADDTFPERHWRRR